MFPEVAQDSPLLHNLNPEQRSAVTLPPEHALILAGAGSGKTRVLTTRIAWLLQTGQVSPGGILAVTFTNKAAKEMMTRLTAMLPVNVRGMWIGTFHGLCNRFLRAHCKLANLPQGFQILDTQDQLSAIKRLMQAVQHRRRALPAQADAVVHRRAARKTACARTMVEARDEETRKKVEIYQLYEEQCQREGVVDFGELMLRTYELLRDNDPMREHYQRRFRHILIDEFQDTNKLQYAWIKMIAGQGEAATLHGPSAVLAVGDDDQSIYAFRGARVGNMADFVREFDVQHQIKLEQNYRSFSNILDSANELISHNKQAPGQEPAHRRRARASRCGCSRRPATLPRRSGWSTRCSNWSTRRHGAQGDRRALPQQRAKPGDRDRAVQCRHAVPRVRRPALLRARRNQARAGLPAPAGEPERRHQLPARRQLPAARHRRAQPRAVAGRGARHAAARCTTP